MSTATYSAYTKQIVDYIRHLTRIEQRETFALILAYIGRETGGTFDSVTDFLTTESPEVPVARREQILGAVCLALRDKNLNSLLSE